MPQAHPNTRPVILRRYALVAVHAALSAAPALAHETWLLPSSFVAEPGQRVVFDLTSGMAFPEPEHAIAPERIARAESRRHLAPHSEHAAGERIHFGSGLEVAALKDITAAGHALQLAHILAVDGVATVCVTLHPKEIELTDEDVQEYFAEIGATQELRASWESLRGKQTWRETYTKHAKTFVAVGQAPADDSWSEPAGLALELVPLVDPFGLRPGQDASFKLIKDGQPLAGSRVGLLRERSLQRIFGTTDAEGRVAFRLDKPGRLLVFAVVLRYAPDRRMWESDFTSLTLLVVQQ